MYLHLCEIGLLNWCVIRKGRIKYHMIKNTAESTIRRVLEKIRTEKVRNPTETD